MNKVSIIDVLAYVSRHGTRDDRVTDDQWRAIWDARLIAACVSGIREWNLTRTGYGLFRQFGAFDVVH